MKRFTPISFAEAVRTAVTRATPKSDREFVTLDRALGRIVASDIRARKNLPAYDNSAMDGFAFKAGDAGKRLRVKRTIFAGDHIDACLNEGECYRIMTGAEIPADADTVAPLEICDDITETEVTLPSEIAAGSNFRRKGEELQKGAAIFRPGHRLVAADIALLSSQGIVGIEVYTPLRIGILSTGNELKEPWEYADDTAIYNANAFGIVAMLESFGFEASYLGKLPDDLEACKTKIETLKGYDAIVTSGGISTGDADFIYDAFLANGMEVWFHGVRHKPGKGVMMGKMGETHVMAMPGNPLATLLCLHAFAVPALFKIAGANACHHNYAYAEFSHDLTLRSGRTDIVLGKLEEGVFIPTRNNKIGSGMLTPLSESNAVAYFGESYGTVEREDLVKVVSFADTTRTTHFKTLNER